MRDPKLGARVRVAVHDPETWATGSVRCLDGMTGTVEAILPNRYAAGGRRECPILVRFDTPARPWATHQTPPMAYHFAAADLTEETET